MWTSSVEFELLLGGEKCRTDIMISLVSRVKMCLVFIYSPKPTSIIIPSGPSLGAQRANAPAVCKLGEKHDFHSWTSNVTDDL